MVGAAVVDARAEGPAESPSFRQDVMPILFRAGCNGGACHGSARGKDGFMLSLFGYDPKGDYSRIVQDIPGRRVNTAVPEDSLLLLKAIGAVPHTGGKLFDRDSDLYKTLLRWIEAGAGDDSGPVPEVVGISLPKESVVFKKRGGHGKAWVTARFSDGTSRDVTSLARFFSNNPAVASIDADGTVTAIAAGDTNVFARYSRFTVGAEVIVLPDEANAAEAFVWPNPPANNFIDTLVFDRLEKLRIAPSDICDDETFLRRVTLDLAARPPTVAEYHAFMADAAPDKRSKKIDHLLAQDAFADLWTTIWSEQLRIAAGPHAFLGNHEKAATVFYEWVRKQMRSGRPLDEFVAEMVGSSGSTLTNPPVNMYTMLINGRKVDPKKLSADLSQLFLGVQIQCAECHNHPFDRWTMDDYYAFTSFFTGIQRKNGKEVRDHRYSFDKKAEPAKHLVDGRPMPAKVLGGLEPVPPGVDPRKGLVRWLTSADNELFSKNLANRIWAQLLGRGIVDPVDDVRVSNPPTNPALLDALAKRFVELKFDLRGLTRDICNSRVYQLSGTPTSTNKLDTRHFSHFHMRRLRADVLLDSIVAITESPRRFPNFPEGTSALDFFPMHVYQSGQQPEYGDPFFHTFGRAGRNSVAVSTKLQPTLPQALHMMVGDSLRDRLSSGGVVKKLVETKSTPEDIVDELFIRVLCRRPTSSEMTRIRAVVGDAVKDQAVYEDVFWSLLNSTEFLFTH
jgi:Protein of unknown function (DUF1549)/Protein of unknown function (DUF1553)